MLFHKVAVLNQNVNLHWAQIRSAHLLTLTTAAIWVAGKGRYATLGSQGFVAKESSFRNVPTGRYVSQGLVCLFGFS